MTIYLGIDPGITGAIAMIAYGTEDGQPRQGPVLVADLPYIGDEPDILGLWEILGGWSIRYNGHHPATSGSIVTIAIEYQAPFAAPGRAMGVTSAFKLGHDYGMLKAFAYTYGLRVLLPRPAAWKRSFGLTGKDKDASRLLAMQRWPGVDLSLKKHHGRAEALLLAEWARLQP